MRSVSAEDRLVQRAANPRTGIISPFIMNDEGRSKSSENDYMNLVRATEVHAGSQRSVSGMWKQDGNGWSIVEDPTFWTTSQEHNDFSKQGSDFVSSVGSEEILGGRSETQTNGNIKYTAQLPEASDQEDRFKPFSVEMTWYQPPSVQPKELTTAYSKLSGHFRRKQVGSPKRSGSILQGEGVPNVQEQVKKDSGHETVLKKPADHKFLFLPPTETTSEGTSEPLTSFNDNDSTSGYSSTQAWPSSKSLPPASVNRIGTTADVEMRSDACSLVTRSQHISQEDYRSQRVSEDSPGNRPARLLPARLRPFKDKRRAIEEACILPDFHVSGDNYAGKRRPKLARADQRPHVHKTDVHGSPRNRSGPSSVGPRRTHCQDKAPPHYYLEEPPHFPVSMSAMPSQIQELSITEILKLAESRGGSCKSEADAALASMIRAKERQGERSFESDQGRGSENAPPMEYGNLIYARQTASKAHNPESSEAASDANTKKLQSHYKQNLSTHIVVKDCDSELLDKSTTMASRLQPGDRRSIFDKANEARSWLQQSERWPIVSRWIGLARSRLGAVFRYAIALCKRAPRSISLLKAHGSTPDELVGAVQDLVLGSISIVVLFNLCAMLVRGFLLLSRVLYWTCHPLSLMYYILKWSVSD